MIGATVEHLNSALHKQCDGNPHCFQIIPGKDAEDQRALVLMASSHAEADAWVQSLRIASQASSADFLDGLKPSSIKSMGSTHCRQVLDLTPDEE